MRKQPLDLPARDIDSIAERVSLCAQAARDAIGPGRAVEDYESALDRALRADKLQFAWQYPIGVPFDGPPDRGFYADFIVEGWTLLELKVVDRLTLEHADLALNYLRESSCKLCLLINFGQPKVEITRILPSGEVSHAE